MRLHHMPEDIVVLRALRDVVLPTLEQHLGPASVQTIDIDGGLQMWGWQEDATRWLGILTCYAPMITAHVWTLRGRRIFSSSPWMVCTGGTVDPKNIASIVRYWHQRTALRRRMSTSNAIP